MTIGLQLATGVTGDDDGSSGSKGISHAAVSCVDVINGKVGSMRNAGDEGRHVLPRMS